jgi:ADP-heptose:LPS heptosyltransferase
MSGGHVERLRIVLLRALGLGDFLTGIPAYRAVRRRFPDADITLAAPAWLRPLAELTGALDRLLPTGELQPVRWPFGTPPDLAVDLHGRGPESRRLLAALGPGRLIAFDPGEGAGSGDDGFGFGNGFRNGSSGLSGSRSGSGSGSRWRPDEHEVDRWCRLLAEHGIPADPEDLDLPRPSSIRSPAPGCVVIHPGASTAARQWPAKRFAAVAERLCEEGHRIVVTGSASERPLASDVAAQAGLPATAVLAGSTTLTELALLVADAALVISGDTGTAHLATAYRRPSVVLFGPVPPTEWGPPRRRRQHVALYRAPQGYRGDPHGSLLDPGLDSISVADVLGAVELAQGAFGTLGAKRRKQTIRER